MISEKSGIEGFSDWKTGVTMADVNGDGFDDLIVGARNGDDGGNFAGEAYVVFGGAGTFGSDVSGRQVIDLTSLSAAQGFIIQGAAAGDQARGEIFRSTHAAGEPVVEALAIGDDPAAGRDPRALEQAGADRIAHRDAELSAVARADHAGHTRSQHMLSEKHAAQRAEFVAGPDIDVFFALRVAEGQMGMHVHQTWHDKVIAGVHNAVTRLWLRRQGRRTDIRQQAVFHDQRLLLTGVQASTVEQGLAFEVQGIHGVFHFADCYAKRG